MTLFLNAANASSAVTLTSPNPQTVGNFGRSVAISGTTVVVGAPAETGGGYSLAGHAYIIDTTTDPLTFTLTSPNAEAGGAFGLSVAISDPTVVVGAPGETAGGHSRAGHAYVFDASDGSLLVTLTSPNAQDSGQFGVAVAISGTTVVVGAATETEGVHTFAGHAYVFDATDGSLLATLTSPNAESFGSFGESVAISCTTVVVGAHRETVGLQHDAGRAYTFDATTGTLIATLTSPYAQTNGLFGLSVAIEGDPTVVVGAPSETASGQASAGHAYIF